MKRLFLVTALGLAAALSVGAQTTTSDEKQDATQPQTKTNVEQNTKATHERSKTHRPSADKERTNVREKSQTNVNENANVKERENTRVKEHGNAQLDERTTTATGRGGVTVFRNGHETTENLNLRRMTRERTDVHFSIGTHPRDWWLNTYSIVLMEGCHYYLADNGCWYPAYGFDPSCTYPEGVVYCE